MTPQKGKGKKDKGTLFFCIGVIKRAWRRGVHIEVDEKASVHGERSVTAQSGMDMADEATTEAAEAMLAEAAVETQNPIVEVGINSALYAVVRAFTPCGLFSSGPSSALADALSSARSVQATAKQTISDTPIKVEMPALIPKSAAASHLAPPPPHRHSLGPARPYALDDGGDTNLDDIDDIDAAVAEEVQAQAEAQAEAAGERLVGIMRIRGGGCAASKPRAQAEPFIQDLDGPSGSPLAVEPGPEAVAPEDVNVAEPVPETIDTMPTEVVEPAAGAATEAEPARASEAAAETKNPIVEIGNSILDAIVLAFTPRGLFSSGPSNSPTQSNAVHDGAREDDTNLDDIDDDEHAVRPTEAMGAQSEKISPEQISPDAGTPLPPKLIRALTELDKIVIQVLMCGAIRLICVKWLLTRPDNFKMPNRQALEEIERSGASPSPLLSPREAAALVRRGDRSIGALTYGWLSPGDPDPDGSRMRVLRRALARLAIEALFWDFGSLYQAERTPEQKDLFEIALKGGAMNQLYASILATTVLQIEEIPIRPAAFDGVVCLFELSSNADENVVRAALIGFGTIESCDLSRSPAIVRVRFTSHESAVAAKNAGAPPGLCAGLDTLYNETPYFSRGW